MKDHVDEDDVLKRNLIDAVNPQRAIRDHVSFEDKGVNEMVTPGGAQRTVFINESGLYALMPRRPCAGSLTLAPSALQPRLARDASAYAFLPLIPIPSD